MTVPCLPPPSYLSANRQDVHKMARESGAAFTNRSSENRIRPTFSVFSHVETALRQPLTFVGPAANR